MGEEIKKEIQEEIRKECFCKSELFQRTLAVTVGSFIGVFCAMNLFFALHKPPMMPHHHYHHHFKQQMHKGWDMQRPDFVNGFEHNKMQKRMKTENSEEDRD